MEVKRLGQEEVGALHPPDPAETEVVLLVIDDPLQPVGDQLRVGGVVFVERYPVDLPEEPTEETLGNVRIGRRGNRSVGIVENLLQGTVEIGAGIIDTVEDEGLFDIAAGANDTLPPPVHRGRVEEKRRHRRVGIAEVDHIDAPLRQAVGEELLLQIAAVVHLIERIRGDRRTRCRRLPIRIVGKIGGSGEAFLKRRVKVIPEHKGIVDPIADRRLVSGEELGDQRGVALLPGQRA